MNVWYIAEEVDGAYATSAELTYDRHWSTMDVPYWTDGHLCSRANGDKGFIYEYANGMDTLAFRVKSGNFSNANFLLRFNLRYNGTEYSYDAETNTWKDGEGNVAQVEMLLDDGTAANIGAIAEEAWASTFVTFKITGVNTTVKLVLDPPAYNSDEADGQVHLHFGGAIWYNAD
jgi:hypothetical protein